MSGWVLFTVAASALLVGALDVAGTFWALPYALLVFVAVGVFDWWISRPQRRPTP